MHPHKNRTIKSAKELILRGVICEKLGNFNFDILKMRFGEICPYETLKIAFKKLIEEGKVAKSGINYNGVIVYNIT